MSADNSGEIDSVQNRSSSSIPTTISEVTEILASQDYLANHGLSTAIYLALTLQQPLLLEGEAGVGKTEVAKALASALGRQLVRLQCYEGIDVNQALYEWDYSRQLIYLKALSDSSEDSNFDDLFGARFLLERPLLSAVRSGAECVLLIDEIDRSDDEFEAFLLEVLSDFQITIPEVGTIQSERPPLVVLTSNRTRELHDALKRRCLYHWIDYPELDQEVEIVRMRAPEVPVAITETVVSTVTRLRSLDLIKHPGVAETINWARALAVLGISKLDPKEIEPTLGTVLKERDDVRKAVEILNELLEFDNA